MPINKPTLIILAMITVGCAKATVRVPELSKPKLTLKASPSVLLRPGRVFFTAIIENPDNRYACPQVWWFWGDGLKSASSADCIDDGYIQSVYTKEHIYKSCGEFTPQIVLAYSGGSQSARTEVKVHCPQ